MARIVWQPTGAWGDVGTVARVGATRGEAGVRIGLCDGLRLTTIIARAGSTADLGQRVSARLACDLPVAGCVSFGAGGGILWSAPDQWLVVQDRGAAAVDWAALLDGVAAVTDQSDSRAVLDVSGPRARDALAKGVAVDLHPTMFTPGRTAITNVAHISVQIWQVDDTPRYRIAVPRSFAGSFWSWLASASAAYGYDVSAVAA